MTLKGRVYQTHKDLGKMINRFGCYYRSLLAIAEEEVGKLLSVDNIWVGYRVLSSGSMDNECYVQKPRNIVEYGFQVLGGDEYRCYQTGLRDLRSGTLSYWGTHGPEHVQYTILQGHTGRHTHFRLGDRDGKLLWDPYPGAKIQREERVIFYRVFKVR